MTQTPLRPARAPEAAKASGRRKLPWIVGGALALVLAGGVGAYAMAGDEAKPAAPARAAAEGPFAVTVTGTKCDVPTVGPDDLKQAAKGEFCLVSVSVKNTGTEAQLLDGGAQRVLDDQGRPYSVAEGAAVFVNNGEPSLLDEIKPGGTVAGVLPFDVPDGTRLTTLVLHASVGSAGAHVPLS